MLNVIKERLGENYIENSEAVIEELISNFKSIASNITNRDEDDEKLVPYIIKAVISEYNTMGAEGMTSRSEGSISTTFSDTTQKMRDCLIKDGVRKLK